MERVVLAPPMVLICGQSLRVTAASSTPNGGLAALTDARGNVTAYAYDVFDRLQEIGYGNAAVNPAAHCFTGTPANECFAYDGDGNVLQRQTRKHDVVTFTYDTLNRLATKAAPSEPTVTFAYDLARRVTGVSDNSAAIMSAVPPSGATVSYAETLAYDPLNRPTNVSWSPAPAAATPSSSSVAFTHAYNHVNQRTVQAANDNSWLYYPPGASAVSYTANALDQYTAVGSVTPTYDANGNLTFDGTYTLGYDAENRLTAASGAGTSAAYAYDGQGRRKLKTVNGSTTVFVTDADDRQVLEYDGATGQVQAWNAFALGQSAVLNRMDVPAGTRQTMIPDIQGSILATLDSATATLAKAAYLPYGGSGSTAGSFRYTGLRIDPETAGLYYARARMYSPGWGRFLQPDPVGIRGGINLYAYVGNDPVNGTDPNGTCYPACTIIAGAAIGAVIGGTHAYLEGGDISAILAGAGAGAVAGGVIGSGLPLAVGSAIAGAGASTTAVAVATYGTTVAISGAGGFAVDLASQEANIISGNQTRLNTSQLIVSTGEGLAAGALGSGLIKAGEATAELAGVELGTTTGVVGEIAAGQIEAAGTGIGFAVNHALK